MKNKSQLELNAGKLISAIQKEWHNEASEIESELSKEVMDKGHDLLQASKNNNILVILNGMSISQYLG